MLRNLEVHGTALQEQIFQRGELKLFFRKVDKEAIFPEFKLGIFYFGPRYSQSQKIATRNRRSKTFVFFFFYSVALSVKKRCSESRGRVLKPKEGFWLHYCLEALNGSSSLFKIPDLILVSKHRFFDDQLYSDFLSSTIHSLFFFLYFLC